MWRMPTRLLGAGVGTLVWAILGVASAHASYAPPNQRGPGLDVPRAQLGAALRCTPSVSKDAREPILLLPFPVELFIASLLAFNYAHSPAKVPPIPQFPCKTTARGTLSSPALFLLPLSSPVPSVRAGSWVPPVKVADLPESSSLFSWFF